MSIYQQFARVCLASIAVIATSTVSLAAAFAVPPPTVLEVPVDGSRPRVKGEQPPPPGAKLNTAKRPLAVAPAEEVTSTGATQAGGGAEKDATAKPLGAAVKRAPVPSTRSVDPLTAAGVGETSRSAAGVRVSDKRAVPVPRQVVQGPLTLPQVPSAPIDVGATGGDEEAPDEDLADDREGLSTNDTILLLLDGGPLALPDALAQLAVGYDTFPSIVGMGFDLTVLRPASARHNYGARLGLAVPSIPAANWYNADGSGVPMYHDVGLTFIDAAFEYVYRRLVVGALGLQLRVGLGLTVVVGELERAEVLPTCKPPVARCPHWREVGRRDSSLPSPVWPALRASAGIFARLGRHLGVHADVGFRDAFYAGAGLSLRR